MELTGPSPTEDLNAHLADGTDAHDASAISYAGSAGLAATDVEAALDELDSEKATTASLDAHINDADDAHDASAISFTPAGTIAATNVQAAIEEVAAEGGGGGGAALTVKEDGATVDATVTVIDFLGADFDVSESPEDEVNVSIAAAIARQSALDAHITDADDAHDASAISVLDAAAQFTGTDVEAVLAEIQDNLDAHLADAADAHDASAISIVDTGAYFTGTDVEAALQELGAGGGGVNVEDENLIVAMEVFA